MSNIILHENPADNNDINSNDGHLESLIEGLRRVASEPLGAGIGSTGSASLFGDKPLIIENQYLFIAHESGWIGLVLFLSIFIIIMNRLWHDRQDFLSLGLFASGAGLAFIGLLLPVWVDDTVSIVWWGLSAVAIVGKAKYGISKTNKKQRELLSFVDGFIKGNGYGPSYREIMRALDYKSVSTVAIHIDGLIARGFLKIHSFGTIFRTCCGYQ